MKTEAIEYTPEDIERLQEKARELERTGRRKDKREGIRLVAMLSWMGNNPTTTKIEVRKAEWRALKVAYKVYRVNTQRRRGDYSMNAITEKQFKQVAMQSWRRTHPTRTEEEDRRVEWKVRKVALQIRKSGGFTRGR